jgi:hypothetical protein
MEMILPSILERHEDFGYDFDYWEDGDKYEMKMD